MIKICAKFQTTLAAGISSSAAAAVLTTNISNNDDGSVLPNGDYGFVIDEGNSSEEYVIATISGTDITFVKRGLSYLDGDTEIAGNKKDHRKGAVIKITDHPAIARIHAVLDGTETLENVVKSSVAPTENEDLANKEYVDATAVFGAPDAEQAVKGIAYLSVEPEDDPVAVGDNDPRVPTQDENDALAGTSGTPSSSNPFVTEEDYDASAVKKTGDQTIQGTKTFNSIPVLPSSSPTEDDQAARKKYVDDYVESRFVAAPSSDLRTSANTTQNDATTSYVKKKEILYNDVAGKITVKFDLWGDNIYAYYGRVYINGVAVGTERERASAEAETYSEDFDVNPGDYIQLYVKKNGSAGAGGGVSNFQLFYQKYPAVITNTVITN